MTARPSAWSAVASVTAVGSPRATSPAKVGPDRIASFAPGKTAAAASLISAPVFSSTPLAQITTAAPGRSEGASQPAISRKCWAGTASRTAFADAAIASSPVAAIAGSMAMPGRKSGFSWRSLIAATTSPSRAHKITSRPARRAVTASAVPQAPPPMMPMRCTDARPPLWSPESTPRQARRERRSPLTVQKGETGDDLVDRLAVRRQRTMDARYHHRLALTMDAHRDAFEKLRDAGFDDPAIVRVGGGRVVEQGRLAHPLALQAAEPSRDIVADQAILEVERLVMDIEQHDPGKQVRDVGRLDVRSGGKAPSAAPRQPVAMKLADPGIG